MKQELIRIATQAGEMICQSRQFGVEQKEGHANFVTSVDEAVERFLDGELRALLPEAAIIGEEEDSQPLGDGYTWVIDPIDGTTNFIHDYHFSAISIALLKNRQPVVGLVYQPYTQDVYYAEAGKGATLNDEPIHVADMPLESALVGFGTSPYNVELAHKSMDLALQFLLTAADVRRGGSAALDLAYVACGRHDVFFEFTLKPWDYAAGALLVREAGGDFIMPAMEENFGVSAPVLAANPRCTQQALEMMMKYM